MADISCRLATEADLPAVRRLAEGFNREPVVEPAEAFAARFRRILARDDWALILAESGGEAIGYALVQDYGPKLRRDLSQARMHDLYVTAGHRRRGAGRALLDAVVAWCAGRPGPMVLDWQARPDAAAFYEALGHVGDRVGDNATYPAYAIDLG